MNEQEVKSDLNEAITLTDAAVEKVKEIEIKEKKNGYGLRVAVLAGGCAGYSYSLNLQEKPEESDIVLEIKGIKVFVDKESMNALKGTEINYLDSLEESGFKFSNPNSENSCGCGKSFS
ncbi:iron-sulfur cluster assembly accessory protein [Candidatus Woesearchaeota archaeon]|nr:iron-sulfur cluster assembly accessory protein [Candidatus Woesearchaeota archaeon]MBT5215448.1 iron-sulfur cluster assembly accessory protein [Candidatus Woesearchaeota archaeon]MBT6402180.1 iron-sulfur cluster assembly accessory protein [Candidatus Woesearchaeota archaeon]